MKVVLVIIDPQEQSLTIDGNSVEIRDKILGHTVNACRWTDQNFKLPLLNHGLSNDSRAKSALLGAVWNKGQPSWPQLSLLLPRMNKGLIGFMLLKNID